MTKKNIFYAIKRSTGALYTTNSTIIGLALSKIEAEYRIHLLELKEARLRSKGYLGLSYNNYSIDEVTIFDLMDLNSKEYKRFLKKRRKKIETEIKDEIECINGNNKSIRELETKLELYN